MKLSWAGISSLSATSTSEQHRDACVHTVMNVTVTLHAVLEACIMVKANLQGTQCRSLQATLLSIGIHEYALQSADSRMGTWCA